MNSGVPEMPPSCDRRTEAQAEVQQLDDVVESTALGCKHIAGFDVAVDQADFMGLTQSVADLSQEMNGTLGG
jgi:hypothetical protein